MLPPSSDVINETADDSSNSALNKAAYRVLIYDGWEATNNETPDGLYEPIFAEYIVVKGFKGSYRASVADKITESDAHMMRLFKHHENKQRTLRMISWFCMRNSRRCERQTSSGENRSRAHRERHGNLAWWGRYWSEVIAEVDPFSKCKKLGRWMQRSRQLAFCTANGTEVVLSERRSLLYQYEWHSSIGPRYLHSSLFRNMNFAGHLRSWRSV